MKTFILMMTMMVALAGCAGWETVVKEVPRVVDRYCAEVPKEARHGIVRADVKAALAATDGNEVEVKCKRDE